MKPYVSPKILLPNFSAVARSMWVMMFLAVSQVMLVGLMSLNRRPCWVEVEGRRGSTMLVML